MPLAALLIAGDRPGYPLLGSPQIEFQLRRARAAGAGHAVVFAERVSASLLANVENLRREGMSVDIARSVGDTAELIHPDEKILLVTEHVLIAPERLAQLASFDGPAALLCVRDEPANDRFELIDPTARWTGYALIDGGLLRRTVAMVGDWDLASTLLRRAVQDGAGRLTLTPDEAGREIIIVDAAMDAQLAGRRLIRETPAPHAGWATRWLMAPVAKFAAQIAGEAGVEAKWISLGGLILLALSVCCALAGWIVASLLLLLFGQLCDMAGDIGGRAGAGAIPWAKWRRPVWTVAAAIVALAMGTTMFMRSLQWGCMVLALVNVGAMWLAAPLARDDDGFARWRSDSSGHAIIGLAGFAFGSPITALAVAAVHAAVSLGWAVRRAVSRLASS